MSKRFLLSCMASLMLCYPIVSQNTNSKNTQIIPDSFLYTAEDIVEIAEEFGIDSALGKISGLPMSEIDTAAAKKLALIALKSQLKKYAEWYLLENISNTDTAKLDPEIIKKYISKKNQNL